MRLESGGPVDAESYHKGLERLTADPRQTRAPVP
jgi:hypothetical protein